MALNRSAIFTDETKQFITPYDPQPGDTVTFKLRVAAGEECMVHLHLNDADGSVHPMVRTENGQVFDYFTVTIQAPEQATRYFYTIVYDGQIFYYNKRGLWENLVEHYNFRLVPGLKTPDWAKGALMYHIFVDRFHNGDTTNDVISHEYAYLGVTPKALPWGKDITVGDFCNFYGGDLQGIIDKLGYLKNLGVEVIFLSPVFVSPSSHKYDIQDYDYVDPHFGVIKEDSGDVLRFGHVHNTLATRYKTRTTSKANLEASNSLMAVFIQKAHDAGIKVILDGVFNHCGSFNKWLDIAGFYKSDSTPPGAYHTKNSPYHNYFIWNGGQWPNNNNYDGWWSNSNHPKLNFEDSQKLYNYILEVGKKWVSPPYNADGWRLDVAADLGRSPEINHQFWQDFATAVKTANPQAIILAEHYGDPSAWLNGKEWDTIMNYDAFMEPITWFLTGVSKHSEESRPHLKGDAQAFENAMRHHMSYLNVHALQTAMNQLSNHDHSRFLTRTNGNTGRWHIVGARAAESGINKNIMKQAVAFQMTWPGAPTIYYGDEAGLAGWTDPDNRRPFPWGKEDKELIGLHIALANIRKAYPVLRHGSVEFLWNGHGFLSYGRWDKNKAVVVAINNNQCPMEVELPVWKIGLQEGGLTELLVTCNFEEKKKHTISDGVLKIIVPMQSAVVLGT